MLKRTCRQMVYYALFTAILFVQEQLLGFLPNIQFTIFLLVLYAKVFGCLPTLGIIMIHVGLDCIINGSIAPFVVIPMGIGYAFIPIFIHFFLKNTNKPLFLALYGILSSILYSLCFTITNALFLDISIKHYILADIPFVLLLCASSFLSILWLYAPCYQLLLHLLPADICKKERESL
ncbi:MAG: hypothetical protein NC182_07505 [Prevotella sp.]|nr:hypothetical protein [Staphylococcus sp.]MCM1351029.1 hypothetical protein [Prevotella sp.]